MESQQRMTSSSSVMPKSRPDTPNTLHLQLSHQHSVSTRRRARNSRLESSGDQEELAPLAGAGGMGASGEQSDGDNLSSFEDNNTVNDMLAPQRQIIEILCYLHDDSHVTMRHTDSRPDRKSGVPGWKRLVILTQFIPISLIPCNSPRPVTFGDSLPKSPNPTSSRCGTGKAVRATSV